MSNIRDKINKFNRTMGTAEDLYAFHQVDSIDTVLAMYNWPQDGSMGYAVNLIYHLILDSGIKVKRVTSKENAYVVEFDVENNDDWWIPKRVHLTPRPEK